MRLTRIKLTNFRNIEQAEVAFCSDFNAFVGTNAQGKTSLLEAIFLAICGKSFRTSQLPHLIKQTAPYFTDELHFEKNEVEQRIRIAFDGLDRKITYNNSACPSITTIIGALQGVLMTPDHIEIVKGGPQVRRQYMDLQLAQADTTYMHHLSRYQKAMRQRNALLKMQSFDSIGVWEQEMAHSAAYIVLSRQQLLRVLAGQAQQHHQYLAQNSESLSLRYRTGAPESADAATLQHYYIERYHLDRRKEAEHGSTLAGPHKDDLLISIDGREARHFSSEGQARSCVAALKLAEWHHMRSRTGFAPLFLVDDLTVSFDKHRQHRFLEEMQKLKQVFITSTHSDLPSFLGRQTNVFHVHAGAICQI